MDWEGYDKPMEELAYWVLHNHDKSIVDLNKCPKVGYLGYANGMSTAEWAVVCVADTIIRKNGGEPKDYFTYNVDSSG